MIDSVFEGQRRTLNMHVLENTFKSGRKANQIPTLVIQGVEKLKPPFYLLIYYKTIDHKCRFLTSDKHFKR